MLKKNVIQRNNISTHKTKIINNNNKMIGGDLENIRCRKERIQDRKMIQCQGNPKGDNIMNRWYQCDLMNKNEPIKNMYRCEMVNDYELMQLPNNIYETKCNLITNNEKEAILKNERIQQKYICREKKAPMGLENLGNTCFLNSALKAMLTIDPLLEYLIKNYKMLNNAITTYFKNIDLYPVEEKIKLRHINSTKEMNEMLKTVIKKNKITDDDIRNVRYHLTTYGLINLIKDLTDQNEKEINMVNYVPMICRPLYLWFNERQETAQEFSVMMFESLNAIFEQYSPKNNPLKTEIGYTLIREDGKPIDATKPENSDFFMVVNLPSEEDTIYDITHLILKDYDNMKRYKNGPPLPGNLYLKRVPNYLLLNIERINYDVKKDRAIKNFSLVTFSMILKLTKNNFVNLDIVNDINYQLVAVIIHMGDSPNSGHYVAYTKYNNKWFYSSDTYVTEVTEDKVKDRYNPIEGALNRNANVVALYYKRIK